MKKWLNSLFSSKSGSVSSKRFFGGLGFIVCIALAIVAVVLDKDIPTFDSELLYVCAALLGVDSVMRAIRKGRKDEDNEEVE